jgi:hypothetical protein
MATFHIQPAQPLAADGAALTHVLTRAGVGKHSLVHVTGPSGPMAMLWLNRHGYRNALYVPVARIGAAGPADALLVPHCIEADELTRLLRGGECLRDGGVLIAQTAVERSATGGESIAAALAPLGLQVQCRLCDRGRNVYIARRVGVGGFKQAA